MDAEIHFSIHNSMIAQIKPVRLKNYFRIANYLPVSEIFGKDGGNFKYDLDIVCLPARGWV
jgi:hypothetical protein